MWSLKIIQFKVLVISLLFLNSILADRQLLVKNEALEISKQLNISHSPHNQFFNEGLSSVLRSDWMAQAAIPTHVQEFLKLYHDAAGFMDNFIENLFQGVSNADCKGHVLEFIQRIISLQLTAEKDQWAAYMIDSWGKIPEGMLRGHVTAFGDFDECVQVKETDFEIRNKRFPNISTSFEGRYCTLTIAPISTAICMPSSCSQEDIQHVLVNVGKMFSLLRPNATTPLPEPVVINCTVAEKPDMDALAIIILTLLGLLVALCVGAGVVDYFINQEEEKPVDRGTAWKYFMAFSFYTNTKKWLSTRKSPDDLGCLHGIRVLSTSWVVLAHTYTAFVAGPQWNVLEIYDVWKNWTSLAILNGSFSVDTFFAMSGMLATYNILKMLDKTKGKFNIPMFYVHRIVRLTPTYAILVALTATVTIYLGSGPLWYKNEHEEANCRKNWWINLLYINNLEDGDGYCNGESWYLANDMQFYLLSPFIVYPMWRWRKLGLSLLALYTVLSCISPVLVVEYGDAPASLVYNRMTEKEGLTAREIYDRPWSRIQTFLVGVWLGWILHVTKGKNLKLPASAVVLGWIVSAGTALAVVFGLYPWFDPTYELSKAEGFVYAALSRFAFAIAVAWVIFACTKGYGGIVNSFLSWNVFMPMGRLSFCVYLISLQMQNVFHRGLRVPIMYSTYTMVNLYFAHMVMSYLVGFFATMFFESPFMVLQKLIFG